MKSTDSGELRFLSKSGTALSLQGDSSADGLSIDLRASDNQLLALAPKFRGIRTLELGLNARVKNLSIVRHFPDLSRLIVLRQEELRSLQGIDLAKGLENLSLSGTPPIDLELIGELKALRTLRVDVGKDISTLPWPRLASLQELILVQAKLSNLGFLRFLTSLEQLHIPACSVSDFDGIGLPQHLRVFTAPHIQATNLDQVESAARLETLDLSQARKVKSLRFIGSLVMLQKLVLNQKGKCDDLSFLESLGELIELGLIGIQPAQVDVEVFKRLGKLQTLRVGRWARERLDKIRSLVPPGCRIEYFND